MSRLRIDSLRFGHRGPFDLSLEASECVCLTGPSGSGKTLLLRAIADLDPHEGKVFLDDVESQDIDAPAWRRGVGMLPAESQWWHDTVGEHISHIDDLERLGFDETVLSWSISRLSTGERQRLALLRLLANRPRALLLDEPTANLDAANIGQAEALIASYREKMQAPILWVTHDPVQIKRVASRHFEISKGKLVEVA